MIVSVLLALFYLLLASWVVLKSRYFRNSGLPTYWLLLVFLLKLAAGWLSWWLFTHHSDYKGGMDAMRFFRDGVLLSRSGVEDPRAFFSIFTGIPLKGADTAWWTDQMTSWYRMYDSGMWNDNRTMVRLNALMALLSGGRYYIHLIFSNLMAMIGLVGYFRFLKRITATSFERSLFVMVFLVPSVLFWGSAVSKESLAILGLGLFLFGTLCQLQKGWKASPIILLVSGLAVLLCIRMHMVIILLPLFVAWLLSSGSKEGRHWSPFLMIPAWFFLSGWIMTGLFPDFTPVTWLLQKQKDFFMMMHVENAFNPLFPWIFSHDLFSLLVKSPLALMNTLLAPFFMSHLSTMTLLSFAENIFLLGFLVIYLRKSSRSFWKQPSVLFLLLVVVSDFIITGWITPFAGAVQRYRIVCLPLLMGLMSRAGALSDQREEVTDFL